jgi:TetR/AcrR family transcriptional repressor of nem operon
MLRLVDGSMARNGNDTRQKILDAAQQAVMQRGFAASSVDVIHAAAGVSRGTFFYHFPTKDDLARALIMRYAESDRRITEDFLRRSTQAAAEPLQRLLVFLALHEELFEQMEGQDAGCLFASYSYEAGLFDEATHEIITDSIDEWRGLVSGLISDAVEAHSTRAPVNPESLADLAYGVIQGAFILSRVRGDACLMADHVRQLRTYVELLFAVDEQPEWATPRLTPSAAPST